MANTIVRIAVPLSMMIAPYVVLSKQHMKEWLNLEQPRNRVLTIGLTTSKTHHSSNFSIFTPSSLLDISRRILFRSFVTDMMLNEDNKAIVKTIIAIAKQLDLKVTAEGIEGNEEYQFPAKINCDYGQGYGISKPLPAGDFEKKFLKS